MRKYGKYERRPEAAPVKQPKAKDALLQTYFTSLLCMVLCVTMFLGTSYAWFSSEVSNVGNEIHVGILKVGLYKLEDGKSVNLASSDNNTETLFDGDIRWEPGYTSLETIEVVNEGDLAFKYTLNFTDGTITDGGDLAAVAEHFDVWVYNHRRNGGTPTPASYADITAENSGWVPAGSLAQLLSGDAVLKNEMYTVRQDDKPDDETTPNGTADGVKTIDTYTIALHMNEEASGEGLMGKIIKLNVKLVAYQMGSEEDDFGNSSYDDATFVTTNKELQAALDNATGNTVIRLANDITGDVTATQKPDVKITVDGNGNTYSGIITVDGKSARYETAALTIQNVNFSGVTCPDSDVYPDAYIRLGHVDAARYTNNVTVKDCTFSGTDKSMVAVKSYTGGDYNVTLENLTVDSGMHSMLQVDNVEKGLKITNCKVYSKNGINLNSTLSLEMSDCTFDVRGYAVRFGVSTGGNLGEAKTFVIKDSTLKAACDDGDAVIMFRASAVDANLTLTNTTLDGTTEFSGNTDATTITRN